MRPVRRPISPVTGPLPSQVSPLLILEKSRLFREASFLADPVERIRPVDFSARLIKERSASLTASSEENTFATSGLSKTRFVPLL